MSVEEKFYLLVLDEVRSQPALSSQLPFDLEQYAEKFTGRSLDDALGRLDQRGPCTKGMGFEVLSLLGERPTTLTHGLSDLRSRLTGELLHDYQALCNGALLNLLWRNYTGTEDRINLAKYLKDQWAFAHFLYGLLRGVDGDVGKAHFELYLAVNREPFTCAKQRIERALSLVR